MQRRARLARGRAQIGLQPPAVSAVGVAVCLEGAQQGIGVPVAEQPREAVSIKDARVRRHEVGGGGEVDGHRPDSGERARRRLVRFGRAVRVPAPAPRDR
jgi:hypothetical protein